MRNQLLIALIVSLAFLAGCSGADERMVLHYEQGMEHFEAGNYEKARLEFKNALQIEPKYVEARYALARTFEALQEWRKAVAHYKAAADQDPQHVAARAALARLFLLGNAPERALEVVEEALALDPGNANALVVRGGLLAREGKLEEALAHARRALEADPDSSEAITLVASILLSQGDDEAAIGMLERGIDANPGDTALRTAAAAVYAQAGNREKAAEVLADLVTAEPGKVAHRVRLGRFLAAGGQVEQAVAVLEKAVAELPGEDAPKLALVELLARHRGGDEAVAALRRYIAVAPEHYPLQFALAKVYRATGDQEAMAEVYEGIVAGDGVGPHGLKARNELAKVALRDQDYDRALTLVEEVLAENPQDPDALGIRGDVSMVRGESVDAIADYRAVLRSRPDDPQVLRALAQAHLRNGEEDLGLDMLRTAVETNPDNVQLRFDLAELQARAGDPEGAVAQLEHVLEVDPDQDKALEGLVKLHLAREDHDAARSYAERYRRAYPDRPQGHYFEGLLAQAAGDLAGSVEAFEASLDKGPDAIQLLRAAVRARLAAGEPEQALARTEEAIARSPENFVAHNLRGEVLLMLKRYPEAEEDFLQALDLRPELVAGYRNLALARFAQRDTAGAVQGFRDGIEATDSNALRLGLANVLEGLGRYEEAIATHEAILERVPDSKTAANNLAMLLVTHGDGDEASLARAGELIQALDGLDEPAYLDTVGWVRFKQGDYEGALAALRQAVAGQPDSPELRYHLAMVELRTGDSEAARENLRQALAGDARFRGREEAEATLQTLEAPG